MSFGKVPTRKLLSSKAFLFLFASFLAISLSVAYVASESIPHERFLSISTLDSDMRTEKYYPEGSYAIKTGDNIDWYVRVYNNMGDPEYLSVRMKLLTSTDASPDDTSHKPSPEKHVFETRRLLMNNATWVIPLNWKITHVDSEDDYTVIKGLEVNDFQIEDLDFRNMNGGDFRIVLELWRYDTEAGDFVFAWTSGPDKRMAWNQIWFNVK